MFGKAKT